MPQLLSNRFIIVDSSDIDSFVSEVADRLRGIKQELNNEISDAIVEENVSLAERLMLPHSHMEHLAAYLDSYLSRSKS
jgi:hypothetical protein